MFIRRKIVRGVTYYALVESYRKNGKVRQRILCSLGRQCSLDHLIDRAERDVADWTNPDDMLKLAAAMCGSKPEERLARALNRLERLRTWKAEL